jgi:hypothetical protein
MILILDNTLSIEECNKLIGIYDSNIDQAHIHRSPTLLRPINIENISTDKEFAREMSKKIEAFAQTYFKDISIGWAELTRWTPNSWQDFHIDTNKVVAKLTSITYLNETFAGGRTLMVDGTKIKPITGRTLIFDGNKYPHAVENIMYNSRYTLPIWYN